MGTELTTVKLTSEKPATAQTGDLEEFSNTPSRSQSSGQSRTQCLRLQCRSCRSNLARPPRLTRTLGELKTLEDCFFRFLNIIDVNPARLHGTPQSTTTNLKFSSPSSPARHIARSKEIRRFDHGHLNKRENFAASIHDHCETFEIASNIPATP